MLANQSIVIFICVLVTGVGGADAGGGEIRLSDKRIRLVG